MKKEYKIEYRPNVKRNDKHLDGLTENEKRMIKLMASIIVKAAIRDANSEPPRSINH